MTDLATMPADAAAEQRREFLTFRLGDESYAVDILKVQEIRDVERVTRVPHVPAYLRGVINLRGAIVPVVDLGLMLGFPEPLPLAAASAIVLNAAGRLTGLVVASVSDVIAFTEEEIRPAPELGSERAGLAAIAGIAVREGTALLILDVERLLARIREERT